MSGADIPELRHQRVVAENPYFQHLVDELAVGRGYEYHYIATRHEAVLVVPHLGDGRYLVERIYRHPLGTWVTEFPAGGIDPEEEPLLAAARELREETGYRAARWQLLGRIEALPGLVRMPLHLVLAEDLTPVGGIVLEPMELLETVVRHADELDDLVLGPPPVSAFLSLGLDAHRRWLRRAAR